MNRITRPLAIPLVVVLATACTSAPPSSVAVPPSTTSVATADATRALAQGRALMARGEMVAASAALREAVRLAARWALSPEPMPPKRSAL